MSEPELTFRDLSRRLQAGELPEFEPTGDLWQRIASRRDAQVRRTRRIVLAGAGASVLVACVALAGWLLQTRAPSDIDWQARAQALEIRLHAIDAAASATGAWVPAEDELVRVDAALQRAYDGGADGAHLSALWKRRSELLDVLLQARQQHVEISRI